MAKVKQTKNCIVCLKKATQWSGHVIKFPKQPIREALIAGFCAEHVGVLKYHLYFNRRGCYGFYNKNHGSQEA